MIIFADFDKTLFFKDDERKTAENLAAITTWKHAGHQFCITTGRSYKSVTRQVPQLAELCDFYIVDSGSIILSKEHKMIHSIYFKPQLIPEIAAMMNNSPETPLPFYYTPDYEGADSRIDNVTKLRFWFSDSNQLDKISRNISEAFPVFAVYATGITSRHEELRDRSCFIEIIPSESGKSRAIKVLQETYHIPRETIITVGDGLNDLAMVQDFDGFAIVGSKLSNMHPELNTTPSFKAMVEKLLHD